MNEKYNILISQSLYKHYRNAFAITFARDFSLQSSEKQSQGVNVKADCHFMWVKFVWESEFSVVWEAAAVLSLTSVAVLRYDKQKKKLRIQRMKDLIIQQCL